MARLCRTRCRPGRRNNPRMPHDPAALSEAARRTPLLAETEVLVLGGGPAGIAAAASAAAAGREVLLVERYGFLGGMGTAAGVTNFCGLHANVHGELQARGAWCGRRAAAAHRRAGRAERAACDLRPHAGPGLRRRGLQVRGRRAAAGARREAAVPCAGRRRGDARRRPAHRCAAGRDTLGPARHPRAVCSSTPRATATSATGPAHPGTRAMRRARCCTRR